MYYYCTCGFVFLYLVFREYRANQEIAIREVERTVNPVSNQNAREDDDIQICITVPLSPNTPASTPMTVGIKPRNVGS